jgi:hypothetical protein
MDKCGAGSQASCAWNMVLELGKWTPWCSMLGISGTSILLGRHWWFYMGVVLKHFEVEPLSYKNSNLKRRL